ncbi:MAG: diguanylate cyclase [Pseudomonadota bacterium]
MTAIARLRGDPICSADDWGALETNNMALRSEKAEMTPSKPGRETQRLRLYFLLPLVIAILITEIVPIVGVYQFTHRSVGVGGLHLRMSAINLYNDTIEQHARALEAVIDVLAHDDVLRDALARKDRQTLLERAAPMFARMKSTYGITHLYFTGPDRVNLLRVHAPERYGDVIDRVTTRVAESTGAAAHGIELGPIGTFTLRVVSPWFDERSRRLLGYVELGMETPEVVERIRQSLGAHGFVLIKKEFLDRAGWEQGMRVFGRAPDWDRFPHYVVSSQSTQIPPVLAERIARDDLETASNEPVIQIDENFYRPLFVPIQDVAGRSVANVVLLVDVSREINTTRLALLLGAITYLAGGILLFVLFYRLVGWVGRRIEDNEQRLEQLATVDQLTGLHNYRTYRSILKGEISRAQRHGRPVSVLMLDIDHFKRVNDEYGHMAGDRVLKELGLLLKESVRSESSVCRYGGEEFAIILPELGMEAASMTAERLRETVEQVDFDDGKGHKIKITVSIGVAAFPELAGSVEELTKAADIALYAAKEEGRNRVSRYKKVSTAVAEPGFPH